MAGCRWDSCPARWRNTVPWLEEGFRRAGNGKSLRDLAIQASVHVEVDDDVKAALAKLKPEVALYVGGMGHRDKNFHKDIMIRHGFGDAAKRIQELYLAHRKEEAIAAVPDEWVDLKSLVGPPARIKERFRAWEDCGATGVDRPVPPAGGDRDDGRGSATELTGRDNDAIQGQGRADHRGGERDRPRDLRHHRARRRHHRRGRQQQKRLAMAIEAMNKAGGARIGRLCDALDQVASGRRRGRACAKEFGTHRHPGECGRRQHDHRKPAAKVDELTLDEWQRLINFNLNGTFLFCHAVVPVMKRRKSGKIVNLASIAGRG